eukprot:CAMPEP_0185834196 /NCGR_PEP_ID=MMETSP1353-20130828/4698_1 /TAXON_ID=1077150 /ORGANISM="Erythrolobus australicus, Strain CCMP3124" /LENGTH=319 /DNA_ID=CAMNT_0028532585 /DNA_START=123 /DNA_END=1079 /DNA_ORIENTATION=+
MATEVAGMKRAHSAELAGSKRRAPRAAPWRIQLWLRPGARKNGGARPRGDAHASGEGRAERAADAGLACARGSERERLLRCGNGPRVALALRAESCSYSYSELHGSQISGGKSSLGERLRSSSSSCSSGCQSDSIGRRRTRESSVTSFAACGCALESNLVSVELIPIAKDGNCGFNSIATALRLSAKRTAPGNADFVYATTQQVREALREEVSSNRAFYEELAARNAAFAFCLAESGGIDAFAAHVLRGGLDGHWLGEKWGSVELLALARALKITIEVFTQTESEVERGISFRGYERICGGHKAFCGLLFSGPATGGHF